MLTIESKYFSEIEIDEQKIVEFPQGIPGFEQIRRYIFIYPEEPSPFAYMQAVDEKQVCFLAVNPFLFYPDYEFDLSEDVKEELQISREQDLMIWTIASVRDSLSEGTMNLLGPIVVNVPLRLGKQVILHDTPYRTKHPLVPA